MSRRQAKAPSLVHDEASFETSQKNATFKSVEDLRQLGAFMYRASFKRKHLWLRGDRRRLRRTAGAGARSLDCGVFDATQYSRGTGPDFTLPITSARIST